MNRRSFVGRLAVAAALWGFRPERQAPATVAGPPMGRLVVRAKTFQWSEVLERYHRYDAIDFEYCAFICAKDLRINLTHKPRWSFTYCAFVSHFIDLPSGTAMECEAGAVHEVYDLMRKHDSTSWIISPSEG